MYMKNSAGIFTILSIILVMSVTMTGCLSSSDSTATNTTGTMTPATTIAPLYVAGDIVGSSSSTSTGWLIISYNSATDSYTRAYIYKNTNGTWGYRTNSDTETQTRSVLEKVYKVKITHVMVSSVPTAAPTTVTTTDATTVITTVATATTTTGANPIIKNMDPDTGYAGDSVNTVITGANFVSGAMATLKHSGQTSINASSVSWGSATQLTCTFNIPNNTVVGTWDIVVTNPNGLSGVYTNYFSVHSRTVG